MIKASYNCIILNRNRIDQLKQIIKLENQIANKENALEQQI